MKAPKEIYLNANMLNRDMLQLVSIPFPADITYIREDIVKEQDKKIDKTIDFDWPTFRRDVAASMLLVTSNWKLTKHEASVAIPKRVAVSLAIEYADELIHQLQEEKK